MYKKHVQLSNEIPTNLPFMFHIESTLMTQCVPSMKPTAKALWFSQWLEDDPFLSGPGLFLGAN